MTPNVFVIGGITMKIPLPDVADALAALLRSNGVTDLPSGLLPTVYRAEYNGNIYYSQQYRRVKKRNSHTVVYTDSGREQFGSVDNFVLINNRVIAILRPLSLSCKQHLALSTTAFDTLPYLQPVTKSESFKCCFMEQLVATCFSIDLGFVQYIVKFQATIVFD